MPTSQNEINKDLYDKFNSFKAEFSSTNGYLKSIVEQNDKLLKLLRNALCILALLLFFCVGAIIYGAIGKDGLYSVRETVPVKMSAIPPHNDFDRWRIRHHV